MDLKGFFLRAIALELCHAAMIAGNRWGESALVLRKCTGFGHNGATLLFMASYKVQIQRLDGKNIH